MPISINSVVGSMVKHPWAIAGVALGTAGAVHGWNDGQATSSQSGGEPVAYSANRATGQAIAGVGIVGAAGTAYAARGLAKSAWDKTQGLRSAAVDAGGSVAKTASNYFKSAVNDALAQPGYVSKALSRGPVAIGIGAAAGGLYTAYSDNDPGTGLLYGAGIGAAGYVAHKGYEVWKGASRVPFGRTALLATAAFAVAGAGRAMAPDAEPEMEGVAQSDGMGGYETSTVRDRMTTMGATGDLVFGLHNRR